MAAQYPAPQLRSLYRRILRELPPRQPSNLANPSPIQLRIRSQFSANSSTDRPQSQVDEDLQAGDQIVHYLKAQRMYTTLLERYNPGMNMAQEDRVKMTARRVGLDMADELLPGFRKKSGGDGSGGGSGGHA